MLYTRFYISKLVVHSFFTFVRSSFLLHNFTFSSGEANEAKRTTDGYADLAQIFHEIEDCPAILFNARRKLIMEVKGVIVGNCSTLKVGDKINLFIFKDCIEIAKVRNHL